jgi:hypothetical protein
MTILATMSAAPARAGWTQPHFIVATDWDPCTSATEAQEPALVAADSVRLLRAIDLGFNFLTGRRNPLDGGLEKSGRLATRARQCQNLGIQTMIQYFGGTEVCGNCGCRGYVGANMLPECVGRTFCQGKPMPRAADCTFDCMYIAGRDLPATSRGGFAGYLVGHEPYLTDQPAIDAVKARVADAHRVDPNSLAYTILFPGDPASPQVLQDYLDQFLLDSDPTRRLDVLAYDYYPFATLDPSGVQRAHFFNLRTYRDRAGDRPAWIYLQALQWRATINSPDFPQMDAPRLRFSAFTALAYGFKGVVWFTYEKPTFGGGNSEYPIDTILNTCDDTSENEKTTTVRAINRHLQQVGGPIVMSASYQFTYHESSSPTNETMQSSWLLANQSGLVEDLPGTVCMVGGFRDASDPTTVYLLVVNKSHLNSASGDLVMRGHYTGEVDLAPTVVGYTGGMSWTAATTSFSGNRTRLAMTIQAGEGRWVRVRNVDESLMQSGPAASLEAVGRPTLTGSLEATAGEPVRLLAAPNPFRTDTALQLSLYRTSDVRVTVYNVRGERIRELLRQRVEAGNRTLTWDGRSDDGRRVRAGVYFCRVELDDASIRAQVALTRRP